MRVIITHHVADDLCRFPIGTPGNKATFLSGKENAAVNGLQAIAHIGKRAGHNNGHRIVEIARLHFVYDADWRDIRRIRDYGVVCAQKKIFPKEISAVFDLVSQAQKCQRH